MKNVCKYIEDILPTYIENLTSEDTNTFVEEHLKSCENCKNVLTNMKENIEKEEIENTEIIKKIKKYKKKLFIIKFLIITTILIIIGSFSGNLGYRYYILYNAIEKNTNYDIGRNFIIIEYEESIERYPDPIITYHQDGKLKKVKGDKVLEYCDGENYYYLNSENKTYTLGENKLWRTKDLVNIDIINTDIFENVLDENGNIEKFEIIKLALDKDIKIWNQGFRDEDYYMVKRVEEGVETTQIYFDCNTFFAERIKKNTDIEYKEYRVIQSVVTWREVVAPDLTEYKEAD